LLLSYSKIRAIQLQQDGVIMAASGKPLKNNPSDSKNAMAEVIPQSLVEQIPSGVTDLIYDCSFDAGDVDDAKQSVWLKQPATGHKFFGISSLKKQILALAEYAGPLDQIETYIRKAHAGREAHLQATLMQAITLAVKGLDQTIRDEKGTELDEGMAERLLTLHAELFPKDQAKALEQARLAAPLEDEKAKKEREEKNVAAIEQLFTAFVQNDKDALPEAINTFKEFVKNMKPKEVTDNRYYLNLLHLVFAAFDVLARRGGNLPPIDENDDGSWYGKLGDRFCFEIIGAALEGDMPHRVRQILRSGVYYLLSGSKKAERVLDVSGVLFRGDGSNYSLGRDSYYDDIGGGPSTCRLAMAGRADEVFKIYYEQLRQRPKFIIRQPQARPASQCSIM
jgi:hypothetical protein